MQNFVKNNREGLLKLAYWAFTVLVMYVVLNILFIKASDTHMVVAIWVGLVCAYINIRAWGILLFAIFMFLYAFILGLDSGPSFVVALNTSSALLGCAARWVFNKFCLQLEREAEQECS